MKTKTVRKLVIASTLVVLLLAGGYAGYRWYVAGRQARLITQAHRFLAKSDLRRAKLVLQRALRYNSRDVEASRLTADLLEIERQPEDTIQWRARVVQLNPRSLDDQLALARSAMIFGDFVDATNALEEVDAAGKKTAAYHNIAGAVAAAGNQPAAAEAHFLEATRLEPKNPFLQLNLAVVRLHGTNVTAITEARTALKQVSADPTNSALRCEALRELVVDAARNKQTNEALSLSGALLKETNSVFKDQLLRLSLLRGTGQAEFQSSLEALQQRAADNPGNICELGMWESANFSPAHALAWLRTVPISQQTNQTVALLIAECCTAVQDWDGLHKALAGQNWDTLEFVRHAFLARALRGQDLAAPAKAEWELALKNVDAKLTDERQRRRRLGALLTQAAQWNWENEGEDILRIIIDRYPQDKKAAEMLAKALFAGGKTRELMDFYGVELRRRPSDLVAKNNLAMTALLLDAQQHKPHDLARELYQKAPTNSAYASTFAFSLHMQGKDAEALKILEQLKPEELADPGIAGYYGIILQATGNPAKARKYLEMSSKAKVLPEERTLFDKAISWV